MLYAFLCYFFTFWSWAFITFTPKCFALAVAAVRAKQRAILLNKTCKALQFRKIRSTKIRPRDAAASWVAMAATLAYRCQHNMAPHYLAVQLNRASSVVFRQRLRSASTSELIVPRTVHSTIGDHAFCVTAARAWNTLTPSVQSSESLTVCCHDVQI